MKRYSKLYPQITDFSNLVLAARQAQKSLSPIPMLVTTSKNQTWLVSLVSEFRGTVAQPTTFALSSTPLRVPASPRPSISPNDEY